jgi:serine/threonine protein phosphatase PrpC
MSDGGAETHLVDVGAHRVGLRHGAVTDVGLVREANEDAFLAAPPVYVVADGMGGHDGGDIASAIVVEEFGRLAATGYDPHRGPEVVSETLWQCQRRLHEYGDTHRGRDGGRWQGGTTAVVALLVEDRGPRWLLANLGDSRIYAFARDVLVRVSVDHSLVQELVDAGQITEEEASYHPERHVVTRALGGPDEVEPDLFVVGFADAERVLLCSDGITAMIGDAELAGLLAEHTDPGEAAGRIVAAALAAGGIDNATAVVVDVVGWAGESAEGSPREGESPYETPGGQW